MIHFFSKLRYKKFATKTLSYQFLYSIQLFSFCCFEQQSLTLQCSTWKNLIQKPKGKRKRQVCFAFATLFRRNLVIFAKLSNNSYNFFQKSSVTEARVKLANDEYRYPYIVKHKIIDKLSASWAIDSEPIRARGIIVK